MSNHDEGFEMHKRKIASLGIEGLSNTIEQEFERSAVSQEVKKFKGVCTICNQPFTSGYAVRCSETKCTEEIFHPDCFGSHAMRIHQPVSITVVVRETENDNVWNYVDVGVSSVKTPPRITTVPQNIDHVTKEEIPKVGATVVRGPEDDTTVIPDTDLDTRITATVPLVAAESVSEEDKSARQIRSERIKRRTTGKPLRKKG